MVKKYFTLLLVFAFLFTGCSTDWLASLAKEDSGSPVAVVSSSKAQPKSEQAVVQSTNQDDFTLMLYIVGSDLESGGKEQKKLTGFATGNIQEMLSVDLPDGVNVVMQTGGTSAWVNDFVDPDMQQRFLLQDNRFRLQDEQELVSMGESDTLTDFVCWTVTNFPAKRYGIIFWNHGMGPLTGFGYDELYEDSLTLYEMQTAMQDIYTANEIEFEFVGFDACIMATLETATVFAPYANYMIASEELEPGGGWAYDDILTFLGQNPTTDGGTLGSLICDTYYEKYSEQGSAMLTLSTIDLQKIPAVVNAYMQVSDQINQEIDDIAVLWQVFEGASKAESYGGGSRYEGYTDLYDLADLATHLSQVDSEKASALKQAALSAVVHNVKGKWRENSNGLSIYFPLKDSESYEQAKAVYRDVGMIQSGADLIENLIQGKENIDISHVIEDSAFMNEQGYYEMNLEIDTVDCISQINFMLGYYQSDESVILLGRDDSIDVNWDTGVVKDAFNGMWALLGDTVLPIDLLVTEKEYSLYSAPILLNDQQMNLRLAWIWDDSYSSAGYFEIYGAWSGVSESNNVPDRDLIQLQPGDRVTPIYQVINLSTDEITPSVGEEIVLGEDPTVQYGELPQGDYYFAFEVIDFAQNYIYSPFTLLNTNER